MQLEVCRAAVEARDFIPDDGRHEAKIVRVENTCRVLPQAAAAPQAVIASQAPLLVASKGQHTVVETVCFEFFYVNIGAFSPAS